MIQIEASDLMFRRIKSGVSMRVRALGDKWMTVHFTREAAEEKLRELSEAINEAKNIP